MDSLSKILQSNNGEIRLKVLRFFLVNQKEYSSIEDLEEKTKVKKDKLRKELLLLTNANFIDKYIDNKGTNLFKLNENFEYKDSLFELVFDFYNMNRNVLVDRLKKIGRIKLFYFTGVFVNDIDSDIDILLIIDNVKPKEMNKVVSDINATFANKLRILIMDIEEFNYRYKMFDRFLRLILEGKKIVVVDKLSDQF